MVFYTMSEISINLSGFISEFPLLEVIQFLGMTRKTGVIRVTGSNNEETVSLFIKDGNLLHAESNGHSGLDVFYRVVASGKGYFKFSSGEEPARVTIDKPIHILLLESQRRQDELEHMKNQLPADEAILFIIPNLLKVPPLNTFEWRIISMINGRRTIKRICEKIGDEVDVKKNLIALFNKGVIDTVSEDSSWKHFIPSLITPGKLTCDRPYPPLLRTNLLLKAIDGQSSLEVLMRKLEIKESELIEDIKLLYETQWITFSTFEEKTFLHLKHEW